MRTSRTEYRLTLPTIYGRNRTSFGAVTVEVQTPGTGKLIKCSYEMILLSVQGLSEKLALTPARLAKSGVGEEPALKGGKQTAGRAWRGNRACSETAVWLSDWKRPSPARRGLSDRGAAPLALPRAHRTGRGAGLPGTSAGRLTRGKAVVREGNHQACTRAQRRKAGDAR